VQRIGQDIFRARLMDYWQGRCPLTGISDPALLRASHIIPWSECESDAERLDVRNGLLLSALWDAAFDCALVTFNEEGRPEFSPNLSELARAELRGRSAIPLTDEHRRRLANHRQRTRIPSYRPRCAPMDHRSAQAELGAHPQRDRFRPPRQGRRRTNCVGKSLKCY
jgi:hypothetical protein